MSAAKKPDYTVDSLEHGIDNLATLISVICDIRFERTLGEDDERVDRLLWVARDIADGLQHHLRDQTTKGHVQAVEETT